MKTKMRCTQMTVLPEGAGIFNENAFTITIADGGEGEFVVVNALRGDFYNGTVSIDKTEWPMLRAAIDEMMEECDGNDLHK